MSSVFRLVIAPAFPPGVGQALADAYKTTPRQVRRWRDAGHNVWLPKEMQAALSRQNRIGTAGERLLDPDALAETERKVSDIIDRFESAEKSKSTR